MMNFIKKAKRKAKFIVTEDKKYTLLSALPLLICLALVLIVSGYSGYTQSSTIFKGAIPTNTFKLEALTNLLTLLSIITTIYFNYKMISKIHNKVCKADFKENVVKYVVKLVLFAIALYVVEALIAIIVALPTVPFYFLGDASAIVTLLFTAIILTIIYIIIGLFLAQVDLILLYAAMGLISLDKLSVRESVKLSRELMRGHKREFILLHITFIPLALLCLVTLGIAAIYVLPFYLVTRIVYFEKLLKLYNDKQD